MTISDSTRSIRCRVRKLGWIILSRLDGLHKNLHLRSSSFSTCFCVALIVSVSLLMVSGCSRYKEELEGAKGQIEKLNAEVKKLTAEVTRLNQEKSRLGNESKALSEKKARMQRELDHLTKSHEALSAENKEMKKKMNMADDNIASLKQEKARLGEELADLKKRSPDVVQSPRAPVTTPGKVASQSPKQRQVTPCDAVIDFMKVSNGIIKQRSGAERTNMLEQVRQEYEPKMKGAPEKAIKAAQDWVKEGSKFRGTSKSDDDALFRLIRLRNAALKACGKTPEEAGID